MIQLPFQAAKILFSRPKLLALGFFPGAFTFAFSACSVYFLWEFFLQAQTLWIAVPAMMLGFLASWLVFGNLSLLPVEDALINECQKSVWGEVKLAPPPFGFRRLGRELFYSVVLLLLTILLFFLSLIPFLGVVSFVVAAWMTAYGFLANLYERKKEFGKERAGLFFHHGFSNFLLGLAINFLLFVPILNVFLLGYAQILAALVFLRRESRS